MWISWNKVSPRLTRAISPKPGSLGGRFSVCQSWCCGFVTELRPLVCGDDLLHSIILSRVSSLVLRDDAASSTLDHLSWLRCLTPAALPCSQPKDPLRTTTQLHPTIYLQKSERFSGVTSAQTQRRYPTNPRGNLPRENGWQLRVLDDYRELIDLTMKDVYPILRVDDVMGTLQSSK
ncbi:hypothetical protein LAZ67_2004007 [Cordylochernes scorpioides]|uniref:Uncharacterized protein n=1 Tax=Cordylochernes scorpioides TaxID=51811 RepID=A0ABY6K4I9_9ARAC|nr:hypothetical protein LAZ67_2004007 [Cordylochernes scorpioides]